MPGIAWKMAAAAGGAGEARRKLVDLKGPRRDGMTPWRVRTHLYGGSLEVLRSARKERS